MLALLNKYYFCADCKKNNVKLWRIYCCSYIELTCASCSFKKAGLKEVELNRNGTWCENKSFPNSLTDQIGNKIPAIPILNKIEADIKKYGSLPYWVYFTSENANQDIIWWQNLNNK